jgi:ADP-heptose:LPS heptosyltransferase
MPWLLTERVAHLKQLGDKHEVDYNLDMARKAGLDIGESDRTPYIVTSDKDKKMIDATMKTCGIGGNIIAFHVGASCPSKRWPVEKFSDVADRLSDVYKYDIVLVGGDDTEELSAKMISLMRGRAVDLTGSLMLGELAEFLSRCRLFISNDSGPVHVAAAVGTPVIAIFGRKDPGLSPRRWGPIGGRDMVLHKDAGCDECRAHECEKGFKCLQAVTALDVIDAAAEILSSQ